MSSIASSADAPAQARRSLTLARLASLLPVVAFLVYALAATGLPRGDAAGVYVTAASLVEHGSFAIDGYIDALAPSSRVAGASATAYPGLAYAAGRYYQAVPPGRALLAAPCYALGLALAPLLGPEAPAILVVLLGPLLGALVVARVQRQLGVIRAGDPALPSLLGALAVALLLLPLATLPTVPIVVVAVVVWVAPALRGLWVGKGGPTSAIVGGAALGALALVDYAVGAVALVTLLVFCVYLAIRQRRVRLSLTLLVAGGMPFILLAAWQTLVFGHPWRLAFRFAVDPAGRSLVAPLRMESLAAIVLAILIVGIIYARAMRAGRLTLVRTRALGSLAIMIVVLVLVAVLELAKSRDEVLLPLHWWESATLVPLLAIAALLAVFLVWGWRWVAPPRPQAAALLLLSCLLAVPLPLLLDSTLGTRAVAAAAETASPANYAAPFAIETAGTVRPIWTIAPKQGQAEPSVLRLAAGGRAVSPWIDVWPGSAYEFRAGGDGPLRLLFDWEDVARNSITAQTLTFAAGTVRRARFAAPPGTAGLRLTVEAPGDVATVTDLQLSLVGGVRVEPFPDGQRAALAFSFDWESAMGGLIHSRSGEGNTEGEGTTTGLGTDGGPSVGEAEVKALRMRDGAQFLADLFARYDIRATFYATGYDLLPGNPTCEKFLGDPVYRNANAANGWGSDWWRTHPWYGNDPCSTEAQAPAWYFASETLALAAAGHEIASHTFGHLYVRGVSPEQLAADLEQWNRAATALGLPPARSFAFPWTSSNSLDAPFWAVFARLGMTVLTRLYQTKELPLSHPYELDRIKGNPNLIVFPDYYLASKADAQQEALARIDTTLAVRGYHSLWDHPNEALEQGGQVIWSSVVDYAAAQRERGLWIAPVTEIADYGTATRDLAVTALPLAGGTHLTVVNRSGRALDGVTLHLPSAAQSVTIDGRAATAGDQVIIPTLAPGAQVVVVVRR